MENIKDQIYIKSQHFAQNWIVSIFNVFLTRKDIRGNTSTF